MKRSIERGLRAALLLVALLPGLAAADENCRSNVPGACVDPPVSRPGRDSTEGIPIFVPGEYCGNGICDDQTRGGTESFGICPADCGTHVPPAPVCGDRFCSTPNSSWPGNESASNCPADCPAVCGDGACTHSERSGLDGDPLPVCVQDCGYQACNGNVTLNWTVSGATCAAQTPAGVGHGQSATLVKDSGSPRGSAVFSCSQGRWSATPQSGATCQAVVEGTCNGAYNGATVSPGTITSSSGCSSGTFNWLDSNAVDGTYNWTCSGAGGGGTATCQANRQINNCSSGGTTWNGSCRGNYGSLTHGGSTSVTNQAAGFTGSATVTCNDGSVSTTNTSCAPVPSSCNAGTAAWGSCSAPYSGLGHGNSTSVTNQTSGYAGTATVTCNNGSVSLTNTSCTANSVNGACGSAHGQPTSSPPSSGLCSQGSPGAVSTGSALYTWVCNGANGGTNASCNAARIVAPSCGAANGGTFSTPPSDNLCSEGNASGVSQSGSNYTWSCTQQGYSAASCSATRAPNGCVAYGALVDSSPSTNETWRYHYDGGRLDGPVYTPPLDKKTPLVMDVSTGTVYFNAGYNSTVNARSYDTTSQIVVPSGGVGILRNWYRNQHEGSSGASDWNSFSRQDTAIFCNDGVVTLDPRSTAELGEFDGTGSDTCSTNADAIGRMSGLGCETGNVQGLNNTTKPYKIWQGGPNNKKDVGYQRIVPTVYEPGYCSIPPNQTWGTVPDRCVDGTPSGISLAGTPYLANGQSINYTKVNPNPRVCGTGGTALYRCTDGVLVRESGSCSRMTGNSCIEP